MILLLVLACKDTGTAPDSALTDSAAVESYDNLGLREGGVVTCAAPSLRASAGPMALAELGEDWALQTPASLQKAPLR